MRVAAFVSGGYLPPAVRGTAIDEPVHIADWYATYCALANVSSFDPVAAAAGLPPVDSLNVWPLLSGAWEGRRPQAAAVVATAVLVVPCATAHASEQPTSLPGAGATTKSPRTEIPVGPETLISGQYKLITGGSQSWATWTGER